MLSQKSVILLHNHLYQLVELANTLTNILKHSTKPSGGDSVLKEERLSTLGMFSQWVHSTLK